MPHLMAHPTLSYHATLIRLGRLQGGICTFSLTTGDPRILAIGFHRLDIGSKSLNWLLHIWLLPTVTVAQMFPTLARIFSNSPVTNWYASTVLPMISCLSGALLCLTISFQV